MPSHEGQAEAEADQQRMEASIERAR